VTRSDKPLIYLISDGTIDDNNFKERSAEFLDLLRASVFANVPLVQIREKLLSSRRLFELTRHAVELTANSATKVVVNDRADIALAAGASGVHLTSRSVPAAEVRKSFPAEFLVGLSTHSSEEIEAAAASGADFALFGPVFDSPGKSAVGLSALRKAVAAANGYPVLAIGGVDDSNYNDVLATGAAGFAAIRFLNDRENLERLSAQFEL
jgi:thiamine-phosphate pyrophosphorylase